MQYSKKIRTSVYQSTISFRDFRRFIDVLHDKENTETSFMVDFRLADGSEYKYDSCKELLDPQIDRNINYVAKQKVVDFTIYKHTKQQSESSFSIYFNNSGSMSIYRVDGDGEGMALQDSAERFLGLKTKPSFLLRLASSRFFDAVCIGSLYVTYMIIPHASPTAMLGMILSGCFCFVTSMIATFFRDKNKLKMDNQSDGFITRNRDSILLNTAFLLIGFVLGFVTK